MLQAILIGVGDEAADVRAELSARGIAVEAEVAAPAEAVERFPHRNAPPRVLIADAGRPAAPDAVRQLRLAFPSWPLLAIVEAGCSPATVLAVNRAGADQVVGRPVTRADLGAALDLLAVRAAPPEGGPVVVVVSGTVPGCGCSTVAANLAAELARSEQADTILVEAALQMGVQALNLNVTPKATLGDLVAAGGAVDAEQVRKALVPVAPNLRLLPAPPDIARPGADATAGVLAVVAACKQLAAVVVVDVPCLFDDLHFEALWAADRVVLVLDQSLPAVRTGRMVLDAVGQAKAVKAVHVVVNKYDPSIPALSTDGIAAKLGGVDLLTVPNDYAAVMRAAAEGRTLRAAAPDSPVAAAYAALAAAVTGHPRAAAKDPSLFSRFVESVKRLKREFAHDLGR